MKTKVAYTRWFDQLNADDGSKVGGKNASLGEMVGALKNKGIRVPDGFATTADAYRSFVESNDLADEIQNELHELEAGKQPLSRAGSKIRKLFLKSKFPEDLQNDIREAYRALCDKYETEEVNVAVRSSATAEDLPSASFAGQQETFLNINGEDELLDACRRCYASLFTDRAISYRQNQGFDHMKVALSVGVQKMVRSDKASAGVMFTIDQETGFPNVVTINAAWGLGESVVGGTVTPDEYVVFKPLLSETRFAPIIGRSIGAKETRIVYADGKGRQTTKTINNSPKKQRTRVLTDEEILYLARQAVEIENHYGQPMDIEWAKDGRTEELFIVQARPETVQSQKKGTTLRDYQLKSEATPIVTGLSIGQAIVTGKVSLIESAEDIDRFEKGNILVTSATDPDWVPIMKKAAGIVTDYGGRTSHAAIVSRELSIPAVIGTGNATEELSNGQEVTLSCGEGEQGNVYDGILEYEESEINLEKLPDTRTQVMMNVASPAASFRWWQLPCEGIGLARMEFIVNNVIKIHPMALVRFPDLQDKDAVKQIKGLTKGYSDKTEYFVDHLAQGIARIAAPQYPDEVIVRMSDFKTNEYAKLIGGAEFEPHEENPMLGFRGASRYYSDRYREGFALECRAIKRARDELGLRNIIIMIPFCRTPQEADRVIEVLNGNGLKRGENGLQIYVMCEIPSNVVLTEEFADRFDGFSIGSNDLTQLLLGVDRDSTELAELFDERHPAIKRTISDLIQRAHEKKSKVGICGQAPSDYPEFAEFLVREGIDSISLNPESVIGVKQRVVEVEKE